MQGASMHESDAAVLAVMNGIGGGGGAGVSVGVVARPLSSSLSSSSTSSSSSSSLGPLYSNSVSAPSSTTTTEQKLNSSFMTRAMNATTTTPTTTTMTMTMTMTMTLTAAIVAKLSAVFAATRNDMTKTTTSKKKKNKRKNASTLVFLALVGVVAVASVSISTTTALPKLGPPSFGGGGGNDDNDKTFDENGDERELSLGSVPSALSILSSRFVDVTVEAATALRGDSAPSSSSSSSSEKPLPIFWHVLKSGGTAIQDLSADCLHLAVASEVGGIDPYGSEAALRIVDDGSAAADVPRYVNVDVTTKPGIARAGRLGLAGSRLADVVFTPLVVEVARTILGPAPPPQLTTMKRAMTLRLSSWYSSSSSSSLLFSKPSSSSSSFSSTSSTKGIMFAMFRHPVERAVSQFYYLQVATWEPTYNPSFKDMSLQRWAFSSHVESNWMVRSLVEKMEAPLDMDDLDGAKEIIRTKCLVGLLDEIEESIHRFRMFFGFGLAPDIGQNGTVDNDGHDDDNDNDNDNDNKRPRKKQHQDTDPIVDRCVEGRLGNRKVGNRIDHPFPLTKGDAIWTELERQNGADMELYNYARLLFEEQGELIQTIAKQRREREKKG